MSERIPIMLCLAEIAPTPANHARADVRPAFRPRVHRRYGSERLTDDLVVQALDTYRMVTLRLSAGSPSVPGAPAWLRSQRLFDVDDVEQFIARSWAECIALLDRPGNLPAGAIAGLVAVLTRLRDLEAATVAQRRATTLDLHRRAADALGVVSRSSSVAELFRAIPEQAARLGFDRVLFSTVCSGTWHPQSVYCRDGAEWANGYLTDPTIVFSLPSAATHRHTVRVDAPTMLRRSEPEAGFRLWKRSRSKTFWMVPVVDANRVVAMIHADCHQSEHLPTRAEIEALEDYCRRISGLIVRESLRAGPPRKTDQHAHGPIGIAEVIDQTREVSRSVADRGRLHVVDDTAGCDFRTVLSGREIQVVRLMAEGLTNAQIGRRLTITEGTVKSHVKRILKKTSSANRAEAVANWFNSQPQATG
ncbi:response regulator transcription factor [Gordonia terrae]|uniref:helix-turn-helix transcriptional regulator n=1 Tax=Gordonia terrae TaxID=2055 RepID=UPI003F6ADEC0